MQKRRALRLVRAALLLIMLACLFGLAREYILSVRHQRAQAKITDALTAQEELPSVTETQESESEPVPETQTESDGEKEPAIIDRLADLYAQNNDLVGWLSIPGMEIDYPVMQCADNEYYLHHNFYGEEDRYGCLFVKDIADVDTPGTNFIIYGHNMKDGSMFGDLDAYREEAFYREHTKLNFETLYEERTYEIMAVFLSHVYKSDEEGFRYYGFYQADTEEEFLDFYDNVKALALYDTGVEAAFGDTLLTLSTCAYHEEDGRLVVVAKRVV
ncbi:MAG: class B sortase [Lachnospiraceae bacterium]|nr:class B sortase [Lachnospiraceae bacterium]